MKKTSKKAIRSVIEASVTSALANLNIAEPSKKTKKMVEKLSKKLSPQVKYDLNKSAKKTQQPLKKTKAKNSKNIPSPVVEFE